jgi:hypothetical protein
MHVHINEILSMTRIASCYSQFENKLAMKLQNLHEPYPIHHFREGFESIYVSNCGRCLCDLKTRGRHKEGMVISVKYL